MKTIEHRALAEYFNTLLGSDYFVDVNSCEYVKEDKINCTLQLQRVPFPLDGVDCETLTAALSVEAGINNNYQKDTVMNALTALCGYKSGEIDIYTYSAEGVKGTTETWKVKSFLDFQKPLTAPTLGEGATKDIFVISGTILCSNTATGALMSNDVVTELCDRAFGATGEIKGVMAVITAQPKVNKIAESIQRGNQTTPQPKVLSQFTTYTIQALYLDRAIDADIWTAIENPTSLEKVYYLKRTIGTNTYTKKCLLVDGSVTEQAGAYLLYTITLQETL